MRTDEDVIRQQAKRIEELEAKYENKCSSCEPLDDADHALAAMEKRAEAAEADVRNAHNHLAEQQQRGDDAWKRAEAAEAECAERKEWQQKHYTCVTEEAEQRIAAEKEVRALEKTLGDLCVQIRNTDKDRDELAHKLAQQKTITEEEAYERMRAQNDESRAKLDLDDVENNIGRLERLLRNREADIEDLKKQLAEQMDSNRQLETKDLGHSLLKQRAETAEAEAKRQKERNERAMYDRLKAQFGGEEKA